MYSSKLPSSWRIPSEPTFLQQDHPGCWDEIEDMKVTATSATCSGWMSCSIPLSIFTKLSRNRSRWSEVAAVDYVFLNGNLRPAASLITLEPPWTLTQATVPFYDQVFLPVAISSPSPHTQLPISGQSPIMPNTELSLALKHGSLGCSCCPTPCPLPLSCTWTKSSTSVASMSQGLCLSSATLLTLCTLAHMVRHKVHISELRICQICFLKFFFHILSQDMILVHFIVWCQIWIHTFLCVFTFIY